MAGGESSSGGDRLGGAKQSLETAILHEVGEVSSRISAAKHVDEVICALHSLAVLLFPVNSSLLSGVLEEPYKAKVLGANLPSDVERIEWRQAFYRGAAFPAMCRVLIYNVVANWLSCFPLTARIQVYDSFFTRGPPTEIIQVLVPSLTRNVSDEDVDFNVICSNVERLLILYLLENEGVYSMAREFGQVFYKKGYTCEFLPNNLSPISRMAQLLTSIPDKARMEAPKTLSSYFFFKKIIIQLLAAAEEKAVELFFKIDLQSKTKPIEDGTFSFIGDVFARICRRGSADILIARALRRVLDLIRSCLSSKDDDDDGDIYLIEKNPKTLFWANLMAYIKDTYASERLSEEFLRQLAAADISDLEGYWAVWLLFYRIFDQQTSTRIMFDKFLLLKVFPVRCLRWILHLSVFGIPPEVGSQKIQNTHRFLETVQRLLGVWSKREFVQSAPMDKQAYITAAVGLAVERMSKEELETTQDVLHSILQGVSFRLESPIELVRRMASSIALVFSKVIDPNNPLYLDDNHKENIDWECGLISHKRRASSAGHDRNVNDSKISSSTEMIDATENNESPKKVKKRTVDKDLKISNLKLIDPDEVIDPASVMFQNTQYEDDDKESENSDTSSDSSLQPYDLSDDEKDLKRNFSQLSEVVAALRKSDDPDSVEKALAVAESFVRASPDELQYNTADLVKTLMQLRCSDVAIEGEEETAENKRQKALVSLIVTCPFESLDVITNLLYSPNMDVSQRILIIDVMADAAQELADSRTTRIQHQNTNLISAVSGGKPWFIPSDKGPEGSGPWLEASEMESPLRWSQRYERVVPSRTGHVKIGKSRRWSLGAPKAQDGPEWSKNKFPLYAAAFMLPAMHGFDKKRHGVDFLGRDFIVLGKLIHMLGVCMRSMAMHPEASTLAPALIEMLSSRSVSHHAEAYVRRSVIFAASCVLVALHPTFIASALIEGNHDISKGLEWIRTWALHVTESDPDTECTSMALTCLQLHSEMALQTSRVLESADCFKARSGFLASSTKKDIILPI